MKIPCNGVLLVGPTGAGKTPLGARMAADGFRGRRAAHFDFGEHLRGAAAAPGDYPLLTAEENDIIKNSLETGALLTDDQFVIAEKLLLSFARAARLAPSDWLVLNGMPRHVGQAERVCGMLRMALVVSLECDDDTVLARIATNAGGDRTGRADDQRAAVLKKLSIFKAQTAPLLDSLAGRGIWVERVPVSPTTTPREILARLNEDRS